MGGSGSSRPTPTCKPGPGLTPCGGTGPVAGAMPSESVDILVATFDGERWLAAQLDSLLAQTHAGVRIIIRDDGSRDGTGAIIARYAAGHPQLIRVLADDGNNRRACGNFAELLRHAEAPYAMFCDQDDVWHPDKVAVSLATMRVAEAASPGAPVLVHADLAVVDEALAPIAPSLARFLRLDLAGGTRLPRLLAHNVVTGCTMLMNRPLIARCLPIPSEAIMHDWWVALVAAACGRIALVPRPLVEYRQHRGNVLGAMGMTWSRLARRLCTSPVSGARERIERGYRQAAALRAILGEGTRATATIDAFLSMRGRGWFGRRAALVRHGFWMNGPLRNLGLLAAL